MRRGEYDGFNDRCSGDADLCDKAMSVFLRYLLLANHGVRPGAGAVITVDDAGREEVTLFYPDESGMIRRKDLGHGA